jgi:DNA-directed RNA polymerase subunit A'
MEELAQEKIDKIEFRVMSPELIKKMSVVKIVTPELYDADGYPIDGSLMDLRMSTIDPGLRCRTCGSRVRDCPGHFGHIDLARPVVHIKYIPWIYNFLRAACSKCGRIKLEEKDIEKYREKLRKIVKQKGERSKWSIVSMIIARAKRSKTCPYCGTKASKVKLNKPMTFIDGKKKLNPLEIRERLSIIHEQDQDLLGLDQMAGRPEWMVLTLLPVPPVTVRPSITLDNGQRSEDDLTHKMSDIVRTNQRLFENLNAGAPEVIIEDLWDLLQYHVTTFFVNNVAQIPPARHRSGRPLKTLEDRLKGKEGRFRRNLAGKRVNYSARTVISPDPKLEIDEVGVPFEVARELTVPEKVTEWNINYLKAIVKRGDNYPGAKYVLTPEGHRKRITDETKDAIMEELASGFVVERHLVNGDTAIFNRQPSLHRMSMMAHRVKVLPFKTFRLNLCVTDPYNADFDGDEMNLHIPQTEEAIAETDDLMSVRKNIISPRYGLPIIGCKQDHISGCFLLTYKDNKVSREMTSQLMIELGIYDLPDGDMISGKKIFSMLLPKGLNYTGHARISKKCTKCEKGTCGHDAFVEIKNGELKRGVIDKNAIGGGVGKLLQVMIRDFGTEVTSDFLYKASLLGISYLTHHGFTSSLSDTDIPKETLERVKETLNTSELRVSKLISRYKANKLKNYPGRTTHETLEFKINEILNRARNKSGRIVESVSNINNHTWVMIESGARGSILNMSFMSAVIGQMNLRGFRINKGFFKRTLPHFEMKDLGTTSHGFVRHSYKGGVTPFEFFFLNVSGRDSLMDTSMRTPKSGYLQRRLINALQDIKVNYDYTVRDSSNAIVQFSYGDDNVDVSKSDGGEVVIG